QNGTLLRMNPFAFTDNGTITTIDSAATTVPSPQGLVSVQSADGNATDPCPSPRLVAGSGGSNPGNLFLITVFTLPPCTELVASIDQERGTGDTIVSCTTPPESTPSNLPGPAAAPTLTILGPNATTVSQLMQNIINQGWANCGLNVGDIVCSS